MLLLLLLLSFLYSDPNPTYVHVVAIACALIASSMLHVVGIETNTIQYNTVDAILQSRCTCTQCIVLEGVNQHTCTHNTHNRLVCVVKPKSKTRNANSVY